MYSTRYFCQLLIKLGISFRKISNFMKMRPVGADLFRADGEPDRHEANSRFCESSQKHRIFTHSSFTCLFQHFGYNYAFSMIYVAAY